MIDIMTLLMGIFSVIQGRSVSVIDERFPSEMGECVIVTLSVVYY
jgi:hypothetical protein